MRKVILFPVIFLFAGYLLAGCHSMPIDGAEKASFDGRVTSIVASR